MSRAGARLPTHTSALTEAAEANATPAYSLTSRLGVQAAGLIKCRRRPHLFRLIFFFTVTIMILHI
jgi:hypothetical protein